MGKWRAASGRNKRLPTAYGLDAATRTATMNKLLKWIHAHEVELIIATIAFVLRFGWGIAWVIMALRVG